MGVKYTKKTTTIKKKKKHPAGTTKCKHCGGDGYVKPRKK